MCPLSAGTSFSIGASVPVRGGRKGPLPNPPAPPPSMAPLPKSGAEAAPQQASTSGAHNLLLTCNNTIMTATLMIKKLVITITLSNSC